MQCLQRVSKESKELQGVMRVNKEFQGVSKEEQGVMRVNKE